MTIDPNIISGLQQPKFDSPVNALAQMLQVQGAQQQNQLGAAKLDEYSRGVDRSNKLRDLISGLGGSATDDQRINAMKTGGYFDEADKLQTGMLARQKTGAEVAKDTATANKTDQDTLGLKLQHHKDQLGPIADPASAAQWVAAMYQDPDMAPIVKMSGKTLDQVVAAIPQDPAGFAKWKLQSSLGADKLVEYTTANANTVANNQQSNTNSLRTESTQRRGQDITAGTARVGQEQAERHFGITNGKGVIVQTESGPMLADPRTGAAMPITENGQPVSSKLKPIPASVNTAIIANSQSLSQLDKTIALLEGQSVAGQVGDTAATGMKGYLPQQALNWIDPKGVDARAGVADIGSLKLHDRSGAAVTASESPRLMPFIPIATDSNETALKKLRRLKQEVQSESAAMGDTYSKEQGYKPNPILARAPAAAPAATAKPSLDDIFGKK